MHAVDEAPSSDLATGTIFYTNLPAASSILGYVSTLHWRWWWWGLSCWNPVFHYLCYWMSFLYHPLC